MEDDALDDRARWENISILEKPTEIVGSFEDHTGNILKGVLRYRIILGAGHNGLDAEARKSSIWGEDVTPFFMN